MKRTQCILGIALTVLVVYATLSLAGVMSDLNEAMAAAAELEAKLAQAHSENAKLRADIDSLGTDESAEKLAREKLGLVKSNEIVFIDMN